MPKLLGVGLGYDRKHHKHLETKQCKLCKLMEQVCGSQFENYFEICTIPMLRHKIMSWGGGKLQIGTKRLGKHHEHLERNQCKL
ncbi:unnamed protein product [Camellia sinensis]